MASNLYSSEPAFLCGRRGIQSAMLSSVVLVVNCLLASIEQAGSLNGSIAKNSKTQDQCEIPPPPLLRSPGLKHGSGWVYVAPEDRCKDRILRCWGVGGKAGRQEQKRRACAPTTWSPRTGVLLFPGSLGSVCLHIWAYPSSSCLWPSSSSPRTRLRAHLLKAGLWLILHPSFWFLHSVPLWN